MVKLWHDDGDGSVVEMVGRFSLRKIVADSDGNDVTPLWCVVAGAVDVDELKTF